MSFMDSLRTTFLGAGKSSQAAPRAAMGPRELALMLGEGSGHVTVRDAMRNSAVNRCVSLVSGAIAYLPLQLLERDRSGVGGGRAKEHSVDRLFRYKANTWQAPGKFKRLMQHRVLTRGNAYAFPIRSGGRVSELIPLDPGAVRVEQQSDWSVQYIYRVKGQAERRIESQDMFHLMGPSEDGITGLAMTDVARDVLGLSRKSDRSMISMMDKGIRPGGMLSTDQKLSEQAIKNLREQFQDEYGGVENEGKWFIGEQGLEAKPFNINARESQAVEFRNQQVEEVARLFGVPRPFLMLDDTSWGSGIEQLAIYFIQYGLGPWFTCWEEEIALKLLSERETERYYAKFNERALLRGSMKDQGEFLSKLMGSGGAPQIVEANEARGWLDLPPHSDGAGLNKGSVNSGANNAQPTR